METVRYFVSRHRDGRPSRLVRIRRSDRGVQGEFFQNGTWHESGRVRNYEIDPFAGDEISEAEATQIARVFGRPPEAQVLTSRFEEALLLANRMHRNQWRTASSVPYIAHLLGVTALVLEDEGTEDEAIAALLHDAVEDQGGRPTLERIRSQFGERVARIVEGCTDEVLEPGQRPTPWRERKERYLAHLQSADTSVRRVSLADKLQNARAIVRDFRRLGEAVWWRFSGGREGVLWYYRALVDVHASTPSMLEGEFVEVVDELERLARTGGGPGGR